MSIDDELAGIFMSVAGYEYPTDNLVAHWPFLTDANDISGNGFHGNVSGATFTGTNRFGEANNALVFDHIDDVVDHSAKVVPIGAKTLHRWLNTTATPRMALFDNSGTPSTKFGLTFFITDAGLLRALLVDGADPPIFDLTGTVDVTDGIDRVVTITWDGTTDTDAVKLLANGVVCAEGTATGLETTTPSNNLRVGLLGNPFPTSWPYGDIMEEGLVYSGAWTVAETLEMYNGKKP